MDTLIYYMSYSDCCKIFAGHISSMSLAFIFIFILTPLHICIIGTLITIGNTFTPCLCTIGFTRETHCTVRSFMSELYNNLISSLICNLLKIIVVCKSLEFSALYFCSIIFIPIPCSSACTPTIDHIKH